ncbi:MAG: Rrf2 family transcriptional regulator [Candidatus Omnitrophota bacterium]
MKLITRNIHYAVKSLFYFTNNSSRIISVNELVKKLNMRKAFLRRVLQALSKQGMLRSLKGAGGGFILNADPGKIRIIDIVNIFRLETDIFSCLFEKDICPQPGKCLLMREMKKIEFQLNNVLKKFTIRGLLKGMDRQIIKVR